jgi:hypothetical protein
MAFISLSPEETSVLINRLNASANQGLVPINKPSFWEIFWDNLLVWLRIRESLFLNRKVQNFNDIFPSQPPFFISRESWQNLYNGVSLDSEGKPTNWAEREHPGFEIYAFTFCLAIHEAIKPPTPNSNEPTKGYYGYKPENEAFKGGKGYFRVRTILINPSTKTIRVETGNIAYVDLGVALDNIKNNKNDNCLKFIVPSDCTMPESPSAILSRKVNNEVNNFHTAVVSLEVSVGLTKLNQSIGKIDALAIATILNQKNGYGNYFGSERIKEEIINPKKPIYKGSLISLALDLTPVKEKFLFNFKVNPEFETDLPCPQPQICT